jgi:LmbE family N-acetylglucosaminyl deacetylase
MMRERIAVIAAHPDDDVLGCGGTISKYATSGHEVKSLFFTNGVGARFQKSSKEVNESSDIRLKDMARSHLIMGVENYKSLTFPDNQLDTIPLLDLVREIEEFLVSFKPTIVLTHTIKDLNIDHQRISAAVTTACRPIMKHTPHTILFFEIPSSTNWQLDSAQPAFDPRFYVDISETVETKISALESYTSEIQEFPHPRSEVYLRALAQVRGAACGIKYAEGFEIGRIIK